MFLMSKRILAIDDEPDVLEIVRAVVATKGYEVVTASGGEQGLQIAEEQRPDLIICDLMMPRMSGLEVLKRLKRHQRLRTVPVIIVSALGDAERPPEFWVKSLGIDDYVMKPFDPLDLLGRVEYVLRRSMYVSSQGADETRHPGAVTQNRRSVDLQEATPAEVIRAFVEAWNTQDFALEYNTMAEEMRGSMTINDYVERRRTCFLEEKGHNREQRVVRVEEEKISLNVAKVVIEREDRVASVPKARREAYSLKKTHLGWKIIACRTAPAPAPR